MLPRTAAAHARAQISEITGRVVLKFKRKQAFLALLDKYAGLGIGLALIAAYGCIHGLAGS